MKQKMKIMVCLVLVGFMSINSVYGGRKKLMTVAQAKILAERSLVESVFGIQLHFKEEVSNIMQGYFAGNMKSDTGKVRINGIKYNEVIYDAERDIAKVTASVRVKDIINIDADFKELFGEWTVKRVAFSTSTKEQLQKLAALRVAEVDAYKNLLKQISGFTLESGTTIENFMLKSDKVKTSVAGSIMGAELVEYYWEGKDNDAVVKLRVDINLFKDFLPEEVVGLNDRYIEATGYGASVDDYAETTE